MVLGRPWVAGIVVLPVHCCRLAYHCGSSYTWSCLSPRKGLEGCVCGAGGVYLSVCVCVCVCVCFPSSPPVLKVIVSVTLPSQIKILFPSGDGAKGPGDFCVPTTAATLPFPRPAPSGKLRESSAIFPVSNWWSARGKACPLMYCS